MQDTLTWKTVRPLPKQISFFPFQELSVWLYCAACAVCVVFGRGDEYLFNVYTKKLKLV